MLKFRACILVTALLLAISAASCRSSEPEGPTPTPVSLREVSFTSPDDERYLLTTRMPVGWNGVTGENGRETIFTNPNSDMTVSVRFEGRPADWMGYPDALSMVAELQEWFLADELDQFVVTSRKRGSEDDQSFEFIWFEHQENGETVNGLAYVQAIPQTVMVSVRSFREEETGPHARFVIDYINLALVDANG